MKYDCIVCDQLENRNGKHVLHSVCLSFFFAAWSHFVVFSILKLSHTFMESSQFWRDSIDGEMKNKWIETRKKIPRAHLEKYFNLNLAVGLYIAFGIKRAHCWWFFVFCSVRLKKSNWMHLTKERKKTENKDDEYNQKIKSNHTTLRTYNYIILSISYLLYI